MRSEQRLARVLTFHAGDEAMHEGSACLRGNITGCCSDATCACDDRSVDDETLRDDSIDEHPSTPKPSDAWSGDVLTDDLCGAPIRVFQATNVRALARGSGVTDAPQDAVLYALGWMLDNGEWAWLIEEVLLNGGWPAVPAIRLYVDAACTMCAAHHGSYGDFDARHSSSWRIDDGTDCSARTALRVPMRYAVDQASLRRIRHVVAEPNTSRTVQVASTAPVMSRPVTALPATHTTYHGGLFVALSDLMSYERT